MELPDAKARVVIRVLMRNQATLAEGERELFNMLTDGEVSRIESRYRRLQEIMRQAGL